MKTVATYFFGLLILATVVRLLRDPNTAPLIKSFTNVVSNLFRNSIN